MRAAGISADDGGCATALGGPPLTPSPPAAWEIGNALRNSDPRYTRRSTISFLSSAMALAGLRPLGQALVQLRIVWQR
jgi:hypothetical protein